MNTLLRIVAAAGLAASCAPAGRPEPAAPAARPVPASVRTLPDAGWEFIGIDESRQVAVAIDWRSFERAGERRRVRVPVNTTQPDRNYRSIVAEQEIDCARRVGRALHTAHYSELAGRGEMVWSTSEPVAAWQWTPGTLGEAMNTAICAH